MSFRPGAIGTCLTLMPRQDHITGLGNFADAAFEGASLALLRYRLRIQTFWVAEYMDLTIALTIDLRDMRRSPRGVK